MKNKTLLTAVLMLPLLAGVARATVYNYSYDSLNIVIPDANTVGITDSHTVSGIADLNADNNSTINNVEVTLNISGGYNGDLYGYLVLQNASGTTTSILLNRVGKTATDDFGYGTSDLNVTLTGDTTQHYLDIHTVESPDSAAKYLADGRTASPVTVTDSSARTAGLDILNGESANGTWTLYLADLSSGGQSTLNSWGLTISVVPEPVTWALIAFAVLLVLGGLSFWMLRPKTR